MKIAVLMIIIMALVLMARIMMMSFRLKASSFFIQLLVQVEGQLHENERVADKLKQDLRQKRSTLLERRSSFAIRSDGVSFIGAVHEFPKKIDWCPQLSFAGMRWILTRRHSLLRTPVTRSRYF